MNDFRQLAEGFWASPQIGVDEVALAASRGFSLIINNRPDGESPDQTAGEDIAAAARAHGLGYCAVPITPGGFSLAQVNALAAALAGAAGPVLAYCRSGTRSTLLWSLVQSMQGTDPDAVAEAAAQAGYDVAPIRAIMDDLAATARG